MPRYKNKVGKIIELPNLSGKEMRSLKLRRVITIGEHGDTKAMKDTARKARKRAGGMIKKPKKRTGAKLAVRPANSQPRVKKGITSNKRIK